MNKKYKVKFRVWDLGDIALKKNDEVWITDFIPPNMVEIDSDWFTNRKRVELCDLEMHCKEV